MTQEAAAGVTRGEATSSQELLAFLSARSRYAQDELAAAVAQGVTQYVVLGSALDSFAYGHADSRLRVFKVERPLGSGLGPNLRSLGFSDGEPTFFSWLGAMPDPTAEAAVATFAFIGSRPEGSSVVFDYSVERSSGDSAWQLAMDPLASKFAGAGEPARMFLDPRALHAMLSAAGFRHIEDRCGTAEFAHLVTARV